jgi:heme exporter protein A
MATHIDLGVQEAAVFDVTPYRATRRAVLEDEDFL